MQTRSDRLAALRAEVDATSRRLDDACRPHFCDGRWGAYRAYECDLPVPADVDRALIAHHAALHAFYRKRDGAAGFLGSRGA